MIGYKYITGPDDAEFCARVTDLLNQGWQLAGPATLTFNPVEGRVICGQTLVKNNPEVEHTRELNVSGA